MSKLTRNIRNKLTPIENIIWLLAEGKVKHAMEFLPRAKDNFLDIMDLIVEEEKMEQKKRESEL